MKVTCVIRLRKNFAMARAKRLILRGAKFRRDRRRNSLGIASRRASDGSPSERRIVSANFRQLGRRTVTKSGPPPMCASETPGIAPEKQSVTWQGPCQLAKGSPIRSAGEVSSCAASNVKRIRSLLSIFVNAAAANSLWRRGRAWRPLPLRLRRRPNRPRLNHPRLNHPRSNHPRSNHPRSQNPKHPPYAARAAVGRAMTAAFARHVSTPFVRSSTHRSRRRHPCP